MRNVLGIAFSTLALAAAPAAAQESSAPCGKNHFILDEVVPCMATEAAIGRPRAVAADADGNVYFSTDSQVFKVDAAGRLRRFAGDGVPGFSGDGGPAVEARLDFQYRYPETTPDLGEYLDAYSPYDWVSLVGGLAVDGAGNVFIADAHNRRIRRVDRAGTIATIAEGTPFGWLNGISIDREGNLFVGEYEGPLWKLDAAGGATLHMPKCFYRAWDPYNFECYDALAANENGGAYVANRFCTLLEAHADGQLSVVAGKFDRCANTGDGGLATQARVREVTGVAVDARGMLYIATVNCIRSVDPGGLIDTVAGDCAAGGGFSGDGGPAVEALLAYPMSLAAGPDGTLYVADSWNRRVRAITPDGVIRTIAGNGN